MSSYGETTNPSAQVAECLAQRGLMGLETMLSGVQAALSAIVKSAA